MRGINGKVVASTALGVLIALAADAYLQKQPIYRSLVG